MKKYFTVTGVIMLLVALGFVLFAVQHRQFLFSWSDQTACLLYGLYGTVMMGMFILGSGEGKNPLLWLSSALLLAAVCFLFRSWLLPGGNDLTMALGCNASALWLSLTTPGRRNDG
ncbi:MAG: hypothetical protein ACI3U1_05015 [Peptococcaceae bacterium]